MQLDKTTQLSKTILVDIDYTICIPASSTDPAVRYGKATPIASTIETIKRAKELGYSPVLYTARGMFTCEGDIAAARAYAGAHTLEWLERNGVPFDGLVFGKPSSCVIVDDLSVRPSEFPHWLEARHATS